ncbi:MAG: hypothetical protein RLZZ352_610 [Pseudomonadota bacterium]
MMTQQKIMIKEPQFGGVLIEALVAILIFSLGIMTVLFLQNNSIKITSDARYRTEAALLANRVIGQMWASNSSLEQLKTDFATGGAAYNNWLTEVEGSQGLPGIADAAGERLDTKPSITFDAATVGANAGLVTIRVFWRPPWVPENERREHIVIAQIVRN